MRFGNDDTGLFIRGAETQMYPTALRLAASYLRCAKYWVNADILDMLAQYIDETVENGASSEPEATLC